MRVDLAGKIKNTQLSRHKALLSMFEAVVNSFQGIEDAGKAVRSPRSEITVKRDPGLANLEVKGEVNGFAVTDNGIGFDEPNLDAFFTSDTQYKVGRGGKGIGRFIWLKAFEHAEIESHYRGDGRLLERTFTFTITGDQPTGPATASNKTQPTTTVRLVDMKPPYKEHCPQGLALIGHQLIETYHAFLGSDMALDTVSMLANASEARPDLLIFQRALSFWRGRGGPEFGGDR